MRVITTLLLAVFLVSCNDSKKTETIIDQQVDTVVGSMKIPDSLDLYESQGSWIDDSNIRLYVGLPEPAKDDKYTISETYNVSDDTTQRIVLLFQNKIDKLPHNNGNVFPFDIAVGNIVQIDGAPKLDKDKEIEVLLYHDNSVTPATMKLYANKFFSAADCSKVVPLNGGGDDDHNIGMPKKCGHGVVKP